MIGFTSSEVFRVEDESKEGDVEDLESRRVRKLELEEETLTTNRWQVLKFSGSNSISLLVAILAEVPGKSK